MKKRLLVISQVYPPDPTSVGQHMADAAEGMADRGWEVKVFSANRDYNDPSLVYASQIDQNGVRVDRLPLSSFGKKTILHRIVGQLSYCCQSIFYGLFWRNVDAILVSTSPPMGSIVAVFIGWLRKVKIYFWVMDINPDQAVVSEKIGANSIGVKALNWLNKRVLSRADSVLVLDRFMKDTILNKYPPAEPRVQLLPPWPMEGYLERVEHCDNPFRKKHGLENKFVIMYSGNHSLVHPLDTILEAALSLQSEERLMFLFIGGGLGKLKVEEVIERRNPSNILSLPYQPLEDIQYSLSAADVHLVTMGEPMVGLIHPCKFYGAMALAKPFLYIGPVESHIGDVLKRNQCGWQHEHGDVDELVERIEWMIRAEEEVLIRFGQSGRDAVHRQYGKDQLCPKLCGIIDA